MKKNYAKDIMKVAKRKSREEEFELHDKSINYFNIVSSKKKYKRKRYKHVESNE